jgi:hypothetical protein
MTATPAAALAQVFAELAEPAPLWRVGLEGLNRQGPAPRWMGVERGLADLTAELGENLPGCRIVLSTP